MISIYGKLATEFNGVCVYIRLVKGATTEYLEVITRYHDRVSGTVPSDAPRETTNRLRPGESTIGYLRRSKRSHFLGEGVQTETDAVVWNSGQANTIIICLASVQASAILPICI